MKVLQINTVCNYGSTGRIAVELANYLNDNGHECRIAYGRDTGNITYNNTYYIGSEFDHKMHGLLSRITDRQGCFSVDATYKLVENAIAYDPDVIHLHNIHGYYLNYKILFNYLKKSNKPVVWTFHDCWPFTGHCTYFDTVNCQKWKTKCENCVQKTAYPTSYVMDNSLKNYIEKKEIFNSLDRLYIVSPSHWLDRLVSESFLWKCEHRVINNGMNLNSFCYTKSDVKEKLGIVGKKVLLGVASIWGERKGFVDFLKLAKLIHEDTVILMVGLQEEQITLLPKNIIGIRRTNSIEELCEIYSAADYFLNLTYQDNFPTTNIESLACGTPVITYNTGGSVECITENTGYIIECGQYKILPELLRKLKFSRSACIERSKDFALERKYKEYLNLYEEALEKCLY